MTRDLYSCHSMSFIKNATSARTFVYSKIIIPQNIFSTSFLEKCTFQKEAEVNHEAWVVHTGTPKSSVLAHGAELQSQLSRQSNTLGMKNKPELELSSS